MLPGRRGRVLAAATIASIGAALGGCHGGAGPRSIVALRAACTDAQYWDGKACVARGDAASRLVAGKAALDDANLEAAKLALDAAASAGPLDHDANITLWEQRGIAAAYADDEATARAAFQMLLALDPGHFLSYLTSPKATFVFEKVRNETRSHGAPAIEVDWSHGQKVGSPVPLDVTVLADPAQFLARATLFVRARGESGWRAADVPLQAGHGGTDNEHRIVLPAVVATKPVSLELYLRAYDQRGNEVLSWAQPSRPREIPLRYDPPRPWWQKWWVITLAGTAAAIGTGAIVYAVTLEPPATVSGSASVHGP